MAPRIGNCRCPAASLPVIGVCAAISALATLAFLAILALLSLRANLSQSGSGQLNNAKPGSAVSSTERNQAGSAKLSPEQTMRDHQADEEALELLSVQPSDLALFAAQRAYFMPPQTQRDGRFVSSETRLLLDKSCDQRLHKPDGTRSIETQLMADYGVRASERVPTDVFFESLTQFFSDKGQFFSYRHAPKQRHDHPFMGSNFIAPMTH